MSEPQHYKCVSVPSTAFPFTEGKIYRRILGIDKLPAIKDDLGHERCLGNELIFVLGVADKPEQVLDMHAHFEPVEFNHE